MGYILVKGKTIDEYKALFEQVYCDPANPIITFDGIKVKFFRDNFEHAFYESKNWKKGDKTIFSIQRAEKILWIKDTLKDQNAVLKMGWDKKTKSFKTARRVAVVKGNYVVIIHIKNIREAKFITAFEADNSISKILACPDWKIT